MTKHCPDCGVEVSSRRHRCVVCKAKANNAQRRAKYAQDVVRERNPELVVEVEPVAIPPRIKPEQVDPRAVAVVALSEPAELDLTVRPFVYRLWNAAGECLYVGKHTVSAHPVTRVKDHRGKPWWFEVASADYVEVLDGDPGAAEWQQIQALRPRYNIAMNSAEPVQVAA